MTLITILLGLNLLGLFCLYCMALTLQKHFADLLEIVRQHIKGEKKEATEKKEETPSLPRQRRFS